jgi:hypothetical protein
MVSAISSAISFNGTPDPLIGYGAPSDQQIRLVQTTHTEKNDGAFASAQGHNRIGAVIHKPFERQAIQNQHVLPVVEVLDGVGVTKAIDLEHETVGAFAAVKSVVTRAADQDIVVTATIERVVAFPSIKDIIAREALDEIGAVIPCQRLRMAASVAPEVFNVGDRISVAAAIAGGRGRQVDPVAEEPQGIGSFSSVYDVGAITKDERVISVAGVDDVNAASILNFVIDPKRIDGVVATPGIDKIVAFRAVTVSSPLLFPPFPPFFPGIMASY